MNLPFGFETFADARFSGDLSHSLLYTIFLQLAREIEKFFICISRNAHLSQYFPSTESIIGISAL